MVNKSMFEPLVVRRIFMSFDADVNRNKEQNALKGGVVDELSDFGQLSELYTTAQRLGGSDAKR